MVDSASAAGTPRCDTSGMLIIHGLLRKLFRDAPGLVRGVEVGDTARAAVVADHLTEISAVLHSHHTGEDELLWDQLSGRNPACVLHVTQMKTQHERMAGHLAELEAALPAWRESASVPHRDTVLRILDVLLAGMREHFGDEEDTILPIAAEAFTQSEWDVLGEHGRKSVPRNRLFIQLGFMLDSMPAEVRAPWLKKNLPAPARLAYRLVGKRQYEAHRAKVYGTAAA